MSRIRDRSGAPPIDSRQPTDSKQAGKTDGKETPEFSGWKVAKTSSHTPRVLTTRQEDAKTVQERNNTIAEINYELDDSFSEESEDEDALIIASDEESAGAAKRESEWAEGRSNAERKDKRKTLAMGSRGVPQAAPQQRPMLLRTERFSMLVRKGNENRGDLASDESTAKGVKNTFIKTLKMTPHEYLLNERFKERVKTDSRVTMKDVKNEIKLVILNTMKDLPETCAEHKVFQFYLKKTPQQVMDEVLSSDSSASQKNKG